MNPRERLQATEQDILAYADGRIEPDTERAAAVEAYLAANPDAAARVRDYARQNESIRARYRNVLAQPVPERLTPGGIRAAGTRSGGTRAAAPLRLAVGLAGLCGAALIGWLVGQSADAPLERFADQTSRHLASNDNRVESFQSVSALGGTPDFGPEGLELVGTREVDNGDMYEARYEDATGRVLRLFVAPDPQRHNDLLYRTQKDGSKVVYWQQGPLMYALTGDFSKRDLDGLAHTAITRLGSGLDAESLARKADDAEASTDAIEPLAAGRDESDASASGSIQASQSLLEDDLGDATGGGSAASTPEIYRKLQTDSRATQ